jgi:hypothetical protein
MKELEVGARHAVPLQSAKADFVCLGTTLVG